MDVGSKIKKYREQINLTQDDLALKVFVSRQTISNWENNKCYPDIKSLSLLANIFNISIDDLIKEDIVKLKKIVDEESIKKFNLLANIYFIELVVLTISAYPLAKYFDTIGIFIWLIWFLISLITSVIVERLKKKNNIHTYKEITAFLEGKELTHDELEQELGKRFYQKTLIVILTAVIAFIVSIIIIYIFKNL